MSGLPRRAVEGAGRDVRHAARRHCRARQGQVGRCAGTLAAAGPRRVLGKRQGSGRRPFPRDDETANPRDLSGDRGKPRPTRDELDIPERRNIELVMVNLLLDHHELTQQNVLVNYDQFLEYKL